MKGFKKYPLVVSPRGVYIRKAAGIPPNQEGIRNNTNIKELGNIGMLKDENMNNEKPDIDGYKKWLKEEHGFEISDHERNYESVTNRIKSDFEKSNFWIELTKKLREYNDEYLLKRGYPLLIYLKPKLDIKLDIKSFDSFLLKTYRKNILENKSWPNELKGGWILPKNWYSKINDIIRTMFVVKYLDGVEFLAEKINSHCEQHHLKCTVYLEAREEGYYAAHLYTKQNFEIPKITWDTKRVNVSIEIQITTQLQEVIRKLLHKYYEARRKKLKEEDLKWQWNYKSDEFSANYPGHILHYVEGMIMEIREKQKEEEKI